MDPAARRYARWVLIAHVALLGLVLVVVACAVRSLYHGARLQAIEQAKQTQELLAKQTALRLQNYYQSITKALELMNSTDAGTHRNRLGAAIWEALAELASLLAIVDPGNDSSLETIGADPSITSPADLIRRASHLISPLAQPAVSELVNAPEFRGHIVCVPLRDAPGKLVVAFVPLEKVEKIALHDVNSRATTAAMLIDDHGVILSSGRPGTVGLNVMTDLQDPRSRQLARRYVDVGAAGTEVFEKPDRIGEASLDPAMVTIQPTEVVGKRWVLTISSLLSEVENVVKPVFRDAMLWAAFVVLAMTGILVSTSVQMIRNRVRMERLRHDMLKRELEQAREIQIAWLPKNDDDPPNIDLAAVNQPASHISGDFYNWFQLCDGRTAVVIGDVTGHGMSAAFLMATTQLLIRTTMPRVNDPGQCLEEVNRQLCVQVFNGQFVTMQILVLDLEQGNIEIATAGHPAPLVSDGEAFRPLELEPQLLLGIDPDTHFPTQRFHLNRGASLILYTDGVVDALNPSGERFHMAGLRGSLYGRYESAQAILDAILAAINSFRATHALADDLTLVAVQLQHSHTAPEPLLASK